MDAKGAFCRIRIIINRLKKRVLKKIGLLIWKRDQLIGYDVKFDYVYEYITDLIDTKIYRTKSKIEKWAPKNVFVVDFDNKAVEAIRLSKILGDPDTVCKLPIELQDNINVPVVTYRLDKPIRN